MRESPPEGVGLLPAGYQGVKVARARRHPARQRNAPAGRNAVAPRTLAKPGPKPGPAAYFAPAPALAQISSCDPAPPDTPTAPTSLPSSTRGIPPRDAIIPSSVAT